MQAGFHCQFEGCTQGFSSRVDLEDHMQQAHIDQSPSLHLSATTRSSDCDLSPQSSGTFSSGVLPSAGSQELGSILERLTLPDNPMSSVGRLSDRLILQVSDQERLVDVTVLVLSDVGLSDFGNNTSFTLNSLTNLKELNLSYNYLADVVELAQLVSVERLYLSHNMINSLLPIRKLRRLKFLAASHNQLTSPEGIEGLPHLTELNLAANRLCDFDEIMPILRSLPSLELLQLSGNPLMGREAHMRYAVICQLQLRVLDGEAVTNLDFDIALDVEVKRMFANEPHAPMGKHQPGFGVQDLCRSGIAARVLAEVRRDRKCAELINKLNMKAKTAITFDQASQLSLEFLLGRMLHRLYST